jgi:ribosomal protein S18 acetylase RimI-like enzyme
MAHKQAEERILYEDEEFYLRKAKPTERGELRRLFKQNLDRGWVLAEKAVTIVAIDKKLGVLAGGIERDMENAKDGLAMAAGLAVKPEFREKGIGRKLVEAADREMERNGIKSVTAMVSSEYGWRIYKEQGYDYPEETKARLRSEGLPLDRFVRTLPMVKEFKKPLSEVLEGKQL